MADLQLKLACGDYELTRPLVSGAVKPDGIELIPDTGFVARDRHWAMSQHDAYDVCEFNAPAYVMARDSGRAWTALSVFAHRRFRHGFLFVNPKSGIREPRDLIGRRVGGLNFTPAGNVFLRGILEEEYSVSHRSIHWFTQRGEDIAFTPHEGLRIERLPDSANRAQMLLDGDLDALMEPEYPTPFLAGDPGCVQLFADPRSVEIDYFQRTGIFPIMHVTVVRQEIVDRYPWVVPSLMAAFEQAKAIAMKRVANPRVNPLAFWSHAWFEQERLMGPDPWKYGLCPANRKAIDKIVDYCLVQGLVRRRWTADELFAA